MDVSHLAMVEHTTLFPSTLGFRSQVLRLQLVSAENTGNFLRPKGFRETMDIFNKQFNAHRKNDPAIHQDYIGETASLIYSPFYLDGRQLVDAVLNEDTSARLSDDLDMDELDTCRPERETLFLPGLCPACGWDLTGDRESLALVCRNCDTLWRARGDTLKQIRYGRVETKDTDALLMPFWRIEAGVSGIELATYADLVKVANLPKVPQPGWQDIPFMFWAPAFKITPQIFLRLNRQFTFAQPQYELTQTFGEAEMHPITLPVTEAVESLKITMAAILRPPKKMLPLLPDIAIKPTAIRLVLVPFSRRHHDLFNADLNVSINKNTLAHAANL
ncbi:MAG: hypothetical protein SWH61_16470 [Thermodesulfobacteriota bacterium]|nr:hypothetical protein [Thermodesulfobacteriota bacterium]